MSDASVVAGRLQPVMPAERRVGLGLVFAIREIAVGGREAIGAMSRGTAPSCQSASWRPSVRAVRLSPPAIALMNGHPDRKARDGR